MKILSIATIFLLMLVLAYNTANAQLLVPPQSDEAQEYWTPKYTTCKENLNDAIHNCMGLMQNAVAYENALQAQINMIQADRDFYKEKMEEADTWYYQPQFVAPMSILITLLLVFGYSIIIKI